MHAASSPRPKYIIIGRQKQQSIHEQLLLNKDKRKSHRILVPSLDGKELTENKTKKDSRQAEEKAPYDVDEDGHELSILRELQGLVAEGGEGRVCSEKSHREE